MQCTEEKKVRQKCRLLSRKLLRSGKIKKPSCCQFGWCGIEDRHAIFISELQMHHEDYEKPDWVLWVCRECHKKYHDGKISGPFSLLIPSQFRCKKEFNPRYYQQYRKYYNTFPDWWFKKKLAITKNEIQHLLVEYVKNLNNACSVAKEKTNV